MALSRRHSVQDSTRRWLRALPGSPPSHHIFLTWQLQVPKVSVHPGLDFSAVLCLPIGYQMISVLSPLLLWQLCSVTQDKTQSENTRKTDRVLRILCWMPTVFITYVCRVHCTTVFKSECYALMKPFSWWGCNADCRASLGSSLALI